MRTFSPHLQFDLSVSKPRREIEATDNNLGLPGVAAFTNGDECNHGNGVRRRVVFAM